MLSQKALDEFRDRWIPNMTDTGLSHLLALLDDQSRFLIRRGWTRQFGRAGDPSGCLATQVARHDQRINHLHGRAGYQWLKDVVGIDVSVETSHVIGEWDSDARVEAELAYLLREEKRRRDTAEHDGPATTRIRHRLRSLIGALSGT